MKAKYIYIEPEDGNWKVSYESHPGEVQKFKVTPSGLGFMPYPATWTKKRAFKRLHTHLVKRHQKEIERLQESLERLLQLKP